MLNDRAQKLAEAYAAHKIGEIEKGGGRPGAVNWERLAGIMRPHMEKVVTITDEWNIPDQVLVRAIFQRAAAMRQYGGPHNNVLTSRKFLTQAVADYFGIPYEAVTGRVCMENMLKKTWDDYRSLLPGMLAEGAAIVFSTSIPVEFRMLVVLTVGRKDLAGQMLRELVDALGNDSRVGLWLEDAGYDLAKIKQLTRQ